MIKKLTYILFYIGFSCGLWSETIHSSAGKNYSIDLNIYDGHESLLLHWVFPDTIKFKEIKIFRRAGSEGEFDLISNILVEGNKNNKYLDNDCKNSVRYFYYVEIIDDSGAIYKSDNLRPSFGKIIKSSGSKKVPYNNIWELFTYQLRQTILKSIPNANNDLLDALTNMLSQHNSTKSTWVDNFPLQFVNGLRGIMENQKTNYFEKTFFDQFQKYEKLYRNQFLLTPLEWDSEIKSTFYFAKNKWFLLKDSFKEYENIIKDLPPVIILGAEKGFDNNNEVRLLVVSFEALKEQKVILSYLGETIELNFSNTLGSNTIISLSTPYEWEFAQLEIDAVEVDRIDFINNNKIMKTMDQEIILTEDVALRMSKENSEIWLNEFYWNPNTSNISLEVAGIYTGETSYVISVDGEDIWSINLNPSFDMQYVDSTFNLKLDSSIDNVMEFKLLDRDRSSSSLEVVKLLKTETISSHRFPDGEKWRKTSKNSFGSKNIDKKNMMDSSLIPELFVLYQNYPNPFNSNTRISFDLLQDASLSLYVTDATGRIKTIFSDQEFYNSGKYNFDWNAESFSTGVYFFTINAEVDGYLPVIYSRKMIYLK